MMMSVVNAVDDGVGYIMFQREFYLAGCYEQLMLSNEQIWRFVMGGAVIFVRPGILLYSIRDSP
jgi:hypothetical protein